MAYRLHIGSGMIHDASKPHAKRIKAENIQDFHTLEEAKAVAKAKSLVSIPCKRCGFPQTVCNEVNS